MRLNSSSVWTATRTLLLQENTIVVFSWRDGKTTKTPHSRWQVSVKKFQPIRSGIHVEKLQSSRIWGPHHCVIRYEHFKATYLRTNGKKAPACGQVSLANLVRCHMSGECAKPCTDRSVRYCN